MSESEFTRRMGNWVKPSSLPETVLWTLEKGDRRADVRLRFLAVGLELRFFSYAGTPESTVDGSTTRRSTPARPRSTTPPC